MISHPAIRIAFASAICAMSFIQTSAFALNPQPLPPKESVKNRINYATKFRAVALNPQPLPPDPPPNRLSEMLQRSKLQMMRLVAPELVAGLYNDNASLNPQPLPPRGSSSAFAASFNKSALNPQPLPPRNAFSPFANFDRSALNPQPLPPRALY